MKFRLIILYIFLSFSLSLNGEENNKKEILDLMEFPSPSLAIGEYLNDPLFATKIISSEMDESDIRSKIKILESKQGLKKEPDKIVQLGRHYQDLKNYRKAAYYYNQFLDLTKPEGGSYFAKEEYFEITGETYYSLAEIDRKSIRIDNLEKSLYFFTRSLDLNPSKLSLWINIGDCYLYLNKSTEALYCYNKFLEKNKNDIQIYLRIQAASFERDYQKLVESDINEVTKNMQITDGFDFSSLEYAINNSSGDYKESLKLQHHVYLIRLLLLKKRYFLFKDQNIDSDMKMILTDNEKSIVDGTEKILKTLNPDNIKVLYLSGVVSYLKNNYKKAISDLIQISDKYGDKKLIHDDILFIYFFILKENKKATILIEDIIQNNPEPADYLILAAIEFRNKNMAKAELLCKRSLKTDQSFSEAYSGLAVLYAIQGNYLAADEMIKKGNSIIYKDNRKKSLLYNQVRVNEAAIALLRNEKERAYILLRLVLSVDNNGKALQLYNRYFTKE